ncbi:tyrosine-protein kinase receptor Tie-1-like [Patiria miniata]|uniref:Protein kinase domain-containing protein n=1 Tax=Patiria miniata TaxID=46514 RepID=A0A914AE03_PATMI|nr:tyrosine-protein kinase receptor Tie-1-like [Patiria miniata]
MLTYTIKSPGVDSRIYLWKNLPPESGGQITPGTLLVIHRDLAARNILLSEGLAAKVSDFGLSRGEDIYVQTSKRRVPVRWLAIESIRYKRYTTKSDVWSFGILLWEITTIGGTPYPTTKSESLARKLKRGYRMPKPSNCDDKSYALMRKCWEEDPNNRPSFSELVSTLSGTDDSKIEHTYFSFDRVRYENLSTIRPEFDDN